MNIALFKIQHQQFMIRLAMTVHTRNVIHSNAPKAAKKRHLKEQIGRIELMDWGLKRTSGYYDAWK